MVRNREQATQAHSWSRLCIARIVPLLAFCGVLCGCSKTAITMPHPLAYEPRGAESVDGVVEILYATDRAVETVPAS